MVSYGLKLWAALGLEYPGSLGASRGINEPASLKDEITGLPNQAWLGPWRTISGPEKYLPLIRSIISWFDFIAVVELAE
jgi:hypothetical protein